MRSAVRSAVSPHAARLLRSSTVDVAKRLLASGARGAKGHGWFNKYREGLGGRHLQGRWHDRDVAKLGEINDRVFALNASADADAPTQAYLDVSVGGAESRRIIIELASAGWEGYFEMLQAVVERGLPAAYRPSAANAHWPRRLRRLPKNPSENHPEMTILVYRE